MWLRSLNCGKLIIILYYDKLGIPLPLVLQTNNAVVTNPCSLAEREDLMEVENQIIRGIYHCWLFYQIKPNYLLVYKTLFKQTSFQFNCLLPVTNLFEKPLAYSIIKLLINLGWLKALALAQSTALTQTCIDSLTRTLSSSPKDNK